MKQTKKRLYGTLAAIAFFSGVTGAFTFSVAHNVKGAGKNAEVAYETEYADSAVGLKEY